MFSTVVVLNQVLHRTGNNPEDQAFRDILHFRDANISHDDRHTLLQCSPTQANNIEDFEDAVRLFYDKKSVAEFNYSKLCKLDTPIAVINAIHSGPKAALAKPEEAGGLYPVIFIAVGARVMLTANLWQQVGLCNGAAGTVYQLLDQEGHAPPNQPIAVLVQFDDYSGPPFLTYKPKCVPIAPLTFEWEPNLRQQLPPLLQYAITIHKSQGQILNKAVIDIGKSELSPGCTFVAISKT